MTAQGNAPTKPVWQRCRCDQCGRCLTDCPSADLVRPSITAYWNRRLGRWLHRG